MHTSYVHIADRGHIGGAGRIFCWCIEVIIDQFPEIHGISVDIYIMLAEGTDNIFYSGTSAKITADVNGFIRL